MNPWSTVGGSCPQTPTIDLDRNHLRRIDHPNRQFLTKLLGDLVVPLRNEFATDLSSNPLDMTGTDLDIGETQSVCRIGGGGQSCRGLSDLLQDAGTVTVVVQTQRASQGEKTPGGSQDSGKPVREGGVDRRG
jgi:hypothetical protein